MTPSALPRCLQPLRLSWLRRHGVYGRIEWPCIADIKHAGHVATPQGVWYVPRQTNVGVPAEWCGGAIGRDIGKVPLDPDITLVTCMAMHGKGRASGEVN